MQPKDTNDSLANSFQYSDLQFSDLFVLEDIQRLQDLFADAHSVSSVIVSPDGTPITTPSNFCSLCNIIRKTEKGLANCLKSAHRFEHCDPNGPSIQKCDSGGLWDAGAAINVQGKHIANWLIGQVRIAEEDEQLLIDYADKIGANREEYIDALNKTSLMSAMQFEKVSKMLFAFVKELSENAFRNYQLKIQIAERDRTNELLKEKEEQSRHISSTMFDISYCCRFDENGSSSVSWMTGAVHRITGYTIEEIIAMNCWGKLVLQKDVDVFMENVLHLAPGTSGSCELRLIHKDGSVVWVESFAECIVESGTSDRMLLYGALVDITERKQTEHALIESEARFKYIFESSNVAKSITLPSGELNVNKAFCDMFGYTETEIKGKKWQEVTYPEEVEIDTKLIDSILKGEKTGARRIKRYRHKSEKSIWGDVSYALIRDSDGKPLHFITTIIDITEQKQTEDALVENATRLDLAMRTADMAWWEMNLETGGVIFDARKAEMLGYPPGKFKHYLDFMELVHPDDYDRIMEAMRAYLNGKSEKYEVEYRIKMASGEYQWFYDVGTITKRDILGKAQSVAGLVLNISERKKSELELKEISERLGLILENTPIAIWDWNLETDSWMASSKYYTMLGYEAEKGASDRGVWIQRVHPDEREGVLSKIKKVLQHIDDDYSYDARMLHADGSYRWQSVIGHVLSRDQNGKATRMLGVRVDIDEHKRAEEALKESVQLFQGLFNASPDAIVLIDPHHPSISWPVVDCNQACCNMNGYSREEMIGKSIDFIHLKEGTYLERKVYLDKLRQAGVLHTEAVHHHRDGHNFPVEISTSIVNIGGKELILGIDRDITERKKMERELIAAKDEAEKIQRQLAFRNDELLARNKFIQTILDNLPLGVSLNKINEGTATYMNKKFQDIYGWDSKEITSISSFFEHVYPDIEYREALTKQILEDIQSGDSERMHWENIFITRKDGSKRVVNAVNIPLPDQNTMVSTVSDITDLHKTQNDLIAAKEKAEESDRLKSAFLANMSHEIRTPLNSIIGFSELLTDPDFDQNQRTDFAQMINENGNSLLAILSDIMDISKIEAGQVQINYTSISPYELINEIKREFSFKANLKGIELITSLNNLNEETSICSDEKKIRQVLINLVGNAMKFTSKGSIEIGLSGSDQSVEFFVRDTGIGIPEKYHNQLFKRFSQVESFNTRKYGGNGLGLAISKSLVELLGGKIWMESQEGKGSVFYFKIPKGI